MPLNNRKTSVFPISLRTILIFPYALLTTLAIAAVGYISFMNGQAAVHDVARQLRNETARRVQQHLNTFLSIPHQINQINAYSIQNGNLNPDDASALQQYFLGQAKIYPSVSSIYFGNSEGGLIGGGREGADGAFYVTETEKLRNGNFQKFGFDEAGNIIPQPLAIVPDFDARIRPWYVSASIKKNAAWSDIYVLFTGQDMAIAASRPVYDEENNLLGVVSVDIFLSQLNNYLEQLGISPAGQVFIIERSGALVATSTGESLFEDINNDGVKERLHAGGSKSAITREASILLLQKYADYKDIPDGEDQIEFTLDGKRQSLQFLSVSDPYGIDWIVAVVIPESVFMGQIQAGNRATLLLIIAALVIAIGISILITSRITTRISQLDKSAQELAAGEWNHALDTGTHIAELNQLAVSFNRMKERLHNTLDNLTTEISERKRAEEALRESDARFRAISETAGGIIYMIAPDGTVLFANELAAKSLEASLQEIIGKNLSDFFPPDSHEQTHRVFREVIRTGKSLYVESIARFPRGDIWLGTWLTPLTDQEGCVTAILGESRDITERKKMEKEIQAQHEFSTHVINLMGQGLTVVDANGLFEFVNPAYAQLFGYKAEDLIGKSPKDLIIPEDHSTLAEQRVLREAGKTSTYESRLLRADGSIAHVLINGVPRGREGKYEGSITVVTDLTGQKKIEEELRFAKEALEVANHNLEEALARERHLARTDELTGINNRRHLFDLAEQKFAVATRYKQPLAVIMFDIDHFKAINDIWGHIIGDQILTEVAQTVLSKMRHADLFGRYGGEEFIILLPMTSAKQAFVVAERIRAKIATLRVKSEKGEIAVTISIGIVELHHDATPESMEALFNRADEAMYAAKQAGRNCAMILE